MEISIQNLRPAEILLWLFLLVKVEKFSTNLIHGQALLNDYFKSSPSKIVSGNEAFKLYDTYGFPLELTQIIAHEKGYTIDLHEFEKLMEKQREQSGKKIVKDSLLNFLKRLQQHSPAINS